MCEVTFWKGAFSVNSALAKGYNGIIADALFAEHFE
jgi:hypothetical protein